MDYLINYIELSAYSSGKENWITASHFIPKHITDALD